ncbi:uncharacterized protein HKW66_Vig0050100 [Vigna angularis]|uniref:Uncharacterized protein n=1 Tax=Phaseolus angularis TaxID=3914 RepID=A0A8T0L6Y6_PHAAN|nr:uncharacterized protein HKW66_Vig0050100 [Vigna angularis]
MHVEYNFPFHFHHASSQGSAEATANHHIQGRYRRCHQSPAYTALYLLHAQGRAASSLITIVTGPAPPAKLLVPPPPQRLHHGRRQRQRRASPSSREGFLLRSEIVDPTTAVRCCHDWASSSATSFVVRRHRDWVSTTRPVAYGDGANGTTDATSLSF